MAVINIIENILQATKYADEAYAIYERVVGELKDTDEALHPSTLVEAKAKLQVSLAAANKAALSLDAAITDRLDNL